MRIRDSDDIVPHLNDPKIKVLRPANYPDSCPGRGWNKIKIDGEEIIIANLQGRVFMRDEVDDPFVVGKEIADQNKGKIIIIDFHAEATSEKIALGYYLDGKAAAVMGTHTHVQTADEKILESGTAYITDVGMSGPENSVLGVKKEIIIEKFLTQLPLSHKVASGDTCFCAVVLTIDKKTKKAKNIERISKLIKI
jgi:metallophosphoesterase (TIGR00282 family)